MVQARPVQGRQSEEEGLRRSSNNGWDRDVADEGVGQNTGMRLMDKIEYEEWALKAVDPALSPKPWAAIAHGAEGGKQDGADGAGKVSRL